MSTSAGLRDIAKQIQESNKHLETVKKNTEGVSDIIGDIGFLLSDLIESSKQTSRQLISSVESNDTYDFATSNNKLLGEIKSILNQQVELDAKRLTLEENRAFDNSNNSFGESSSNIETDNNEETPKEKKSFWQMLMGAFGFIGTSAAALGRMFLSPFAKLFPLLGKFSLEGVMSIAKSIFKKLFKGLVALDFVGMLFDDNALKDITGKEQLTWTDRILGALSSVISDFTFGLLGSSKDIYKLLDGLMNDFISLFNSEGIPFLQMAFQKITALALKIFNNLVSLFDKVSPEVVKIFNETLNSVINFFKGIYPTIIESVANFFGTDFSTVKGIFDKAFETIVNIYNGIINYAVASFNTFKEMVLGYVNAFVGLWEDLSNFFSSDSKVFGFGDIIKNFLYAIIDGFVGGFNIIFEYLESIVGENNPILNAIKGAFNAFVDAFKFVIEKITGMLDKFLGVVGLGSGSSKEIDKLSTYDDKNDNYAARNKDTKLVEDLEKSGKLKVNTFSKNEIKDMDNLSKEDAKALISLGGLSDENRMYLYQKHFASDIVKQDQEKQKALEVKNAAAAVAMRKNESPSIDIGKKEDKSSTIKEATAPKKPVDEGNTKQNNTSITSAPTSNVTTVNNFFGGSVDRILPAQGF